LSIGEVKQIKIAPIGRMSAALSDLLEFDFERLENDLQSEEFEFEHFKFELQLEEFDFEDL